MADDFVAGALVRDTREVAAGGAGKPGASGMGDASPAAAHDDNAPAARGKDHAGAARPGSSTPAAGNDHGVAALLAASAAFDRFLLGLACIAMAGAFGAVALGVVARIAGWDIGGLDAYAGYAIAAALFLALPQTLRRQEHIRVTLLLEKLPPRGRAVLEWWALGAGLALAVYVAVYAVRLVQVSYAMHDVSQAADATPLWLPQIAMALGCVGFAASLGVACVARLRRRPYFERLTDEASHVE